MSNSLKFTDEGGCITIDVKVLDQQPVDDEELDEEDELIIHLINDSDDENIDDHILKSLQGKVDAKEKSEYSEEIK